MCLAVGRALTLEQSWRLPCTQQAQEIAESVKQNDTALKLSTNPDGRQSPIAAPAFTATQASTTTMATSTTGLLNTTVGEDDHDHTGGTPRLQEVSKGEGTSSSSSLAVNHLPSALVGEVGMVGTYQGITSISLGGLKATKDQIYASSRDTVWGIKKTGREFFRFEALLAESIRTLVINNLKLHIFTEHSYTVLNQTEDESFYPTGSVISASITAYITRSSDVDALIACRDKTLRLVAGGQVLADLYAGDVITALSIMHLPTWMYSNSAEKHGSFRFLPNAIHVLYGTERGEIGHVYIDPSVNPLNIQRGFTLSADCMKNPAVTAEELPNCYFSNQEVTAIACAFVQGNANPQALESQAEIAASQSVNAPSPGSVALQASNGAPADLGVGGAYWNSPRATANPAPDSVRQEEKSSVVRPFATNSKTGKTNGLIVSQPQDIMLQYAPTITVARADGTVQLYAFQPPESANTSLAADFAGKGSGASSILDPIPVYATNIGQRIVNMCVGRFISSNNPELLLSTFNGSLIILSSDVRGDVANAKLRPLKPTALAASGDDILSSPALRTPANAATSPTDAAAGGVTPSALSLSSTSSETASKPWQQFADAKPPPLDPATAAALAAAIDKNSELADDRRTVNDLRAEISDLNRLVIYARDLYARVTPAGLVAANTPFVMRTACRLLDQNALHEFTVDVESPLDRILLHSPAPLLIASVEPEGCLVIRNASNQAPGLGMGLGLGLGHSSDTPTSSATSGQAHVLHALLGSSLGILTASQLEAANPPTEEPTISPLYRRRGSAAYIEAEPNTTKATIPGHPFTYAIKLPPNTYRAAIMARLEEVPAATEVSLMAIPRSEPRVAQTATFHIAPLCHYEPADPEAAKQALAATERADGCSSIKFTGDFTSASAYSWLCALLSQHPPRAEDPDNGVAQQVLVSALAKTFLVVQYRKGQIELFSNSPATLVTSKEVIVRQASIEAARLQLSIHIHAKVARELLDLLRPVLDASFQVAKDASFIKGLEELQAEDSSIVDLLPEDLQSVLKNKEAIRAAQKSFAYPQEAIVELVLHHYRALHLLKGVWPHDESELRKILSVQHYSYDSILSRFENAAKALL